MKTSVCKDCSWLRGVTDIGAGYCAYQNTMVFETDPSCKNKEDGISCEVWVSHGESGESDDDMVGVFWNKPIFDDYQKRYLDPQGGTECKAEFNLVKSEIDPENIIRSLLPSIDTIRGTRKLLRVTIDIIDQ